ncbi:MAG: HelD family protein [Ilumatobacteraceae bacterium]
MREHPDLPAEQAHIDRAYAALVESRQRALNIRNLNEGRMGGTHQERYERNYFDERLVQVLNQMDIGDASLAFGRIDREREPDAQGGDESTEAFHIGRIAVADAESNQLIVDWRAPIAEPFYRATGREPMGLVRRRHFMMEERRLVAIEDELFGASHLGIGRDDGLDAPRLRGESTLLATLRKGRTGQLGDIVATIQAEQDVIIRAPNKGVLVVQGGPGTGKTVVALHRAAYLLYTYRFPLADQGVLVIGPNRVFLRYIERVLPSLGESGVREVVLPDLVPEARFGAVDSTLAKRVKGDLRMVKVLEQAIRDRQRMLKNPFELPYGAGYLRLTPEASRRVVKAARSRRGRHNDMCRKVEGEIVSMLMPSMRDAEYSLGEARARLREIPEFRRLMFQIWPSLAPTELLHDLFGSRALLKSATKGLLTDEETEALFRARAASRDEAIFSDADAALLDEARELLGPRPRKGGVVDEADEIATFGHIVIDEVQDLTPMQLRMASRRSSGAMTVVGDIAQATGPFAPSDWSAVLKLLPKDRAARIAELSVGYRIPREIMEFAGRLLATAAPGQNAPTAVREADEVPRLVRVDADGLLPRVAHEAKDLVSAIDSGRIAVVCPDDMADAVSTALDAAGVAHGRAGASALEATLTVVPVGVVKGLEMDAVIVVEPTVMYEHPDVGPRGLYVALTRSTQRLVVVTTRDLPTELRD